MQKAKPYIISVLIALAVGGLSALFTMGNMDIYDEIIKPSFAPPGIVFPIVWGILYVLMGISSARIYIKGGNLFYYTIQLILNFFWSIIFFNLNAFLLAFIWLVALWIFIILMIISFYHTDKLSSYLQIPYLLWVTFAGWLTFMVYMLNG
jgi:tryptophan-rich sensory protein